MIELIKCYFENTTNVNLNELIEQEKFLYHIKENMFNIKDFFEDFMEDNKNTNLNDKNVQEIFMDELMLNYFGQIEEFNKRIDFYRLYTNIGKVYDLDTCKSGLFTTVL